jgi:hypothetical protein
MKKTAAVILLLILFLSVTVVSAGQPGSTATVFNKRFLSAIKPMMSFEELKKTIGAPGQKVSEDKGGTVLYRWNGGKGSMLTVRVAAGKVLDASMLAPNGNTYVIGKNGKQTVRDK